MIIFVAIPANRLNKKNNRLQFNKSSAFAQLNIIHSSALEYNTQVKSLVQHLYLEVYLQKASSIISIPFYDAQIPFPKTAAPLLIGGAGDIRSNRVFHQSQPALAFIVTENEKLAAALGGRREEKHADA